VFYIILKQLDGKFTAMFREHDARKFWFVPKIGCNLVLNNMNIMFAFTVFHFSSDLQFKSKSSKEIQLNKLNQIVIANTLIIVPKLTCRPT
jgi:hypothetical protein